VSSAAFAVVAFMLTAYVVLDGFDLGVAAIAPLVARSDRERAAAMASIGPFWNGNEVWLIAAGGALFALFPQAYASSFSGFYLPFIVVLWLLMFRGIAMELRGHFPSRLWHDFWDAAFSLSSALLIVIFGVALGNLLRGVPLDASGYFQGTFGMLLNPYAVLVGAFSLVVLAQHGALFAAMRIDGPPAQRAGAAARVLWWVVLAFYLAVSAATAVIRGGLPVMPLWPLPMLSLIVLVAQAWLARRGNAAGAFAASCAFLVTLLATAAATLYPYLLPAYPAGSGGISIFAAAPSATALACALTVTIAGSAAVLVYSSLVWRRMAGKVRVE
jgi:cytochrome d ubiquinol oxidase subunit II